MKINQYNEEDERHGYWQDYHNNGNLWFKGNYNNGIPYGYWEVYYRNGKLWYKGIFDNNRYHGYWEWYNNDGELKLQIFYS